MTINPHSPDAADSGRVTLCYPARILELEECRKKGWNDSAPAYRAGWNDCCDSVASIIAPHSDVGALTEQADAWNAVVVTLNKVSPGWQFNDAGTGMECACAAIAALAAQPQSAASLVGVPDGWVMVPSVPTMPMREAGNTAIDACQNTLRDVAYYTYEAMIRSASDIAAQPAQSVDVADVRLLLECIADDHGGDHFEADCQTCAAFDRLAALTEKGNG